MGGLTLGVVGIIGGGYLRWVGGEVAGIIRQSLGGLWECGGSFIFASTADHECGERSHSECSGDIFGVLLQHFFLSIGIGLISIAPHILYKRQALGNFFPTNYSRKFRDQGKPRQKT
ncbi:MAG: hypothetical protein HOG19_18110 [Gammaproteobacteria bacterium]|nr:hypothetical protein [Gammaproteobacteria bacterium]